MVLNQKQRQDDWKNEYQSLCSENGCNPAVGMTHEMLAKLANDESDDGSCLAVGANPLIAGLLAGLALTFRIDLVVALSLAFLSQLAGAGRGVWLRVGIGCGVGLIPLLVVVVIASPAASWQALVYETIFGWGPNRRLPFSALSPALWREVALVAVGVSAAIGAAVRSLARSGI